MLQIDISLYAYKTCYKTYKTMNIMWLYTLLSLYNSTYLEEKRPLLDSI